VKECKPLNTGSNLPAQIDLMAVDGRGLHSLTSQLNLSRFGHTSTCPSV